MRNRIFEYIKSTYELEADYPFADNPEIAVLRNRKGKWYGLIMNVPKKYFNLKPADEYVDVINVKCDPEVIRSLVCEEGFYPAYHMNKKHWLSIILDGSVNLEEVTSLINVSYELVTNKKKSKKDE